MLTTTGRRNTSLCIELHLQQHVRRASSLIKQLNIIMIETLH